MAVSDLVNLSGLMDGAKCFAFARQRRGPEGIRCPACDKDAVVPAKPEACAATATTRRSPAGSAAGARHAPTLRRPDRRGAGRAPPAAAGVGAVPPFTGLNLSNRQIALELGLDVPDTQVTTEQLRRGLVARTPAARLAGEVEPDARASSGIDEVCVVAGHNGQPEDVAKRGGAHGAAGWQARRDAARWKRTGRRSSA